MKINKKNRTIRLSHLETKEWEDGGPDGHEFRSRVRAAAKVMVLQSRKPVEIYASARDGGWMADVVEPPLSVD